MAHSGYGLALPQSAAQREKHHRPLAIAVLLCVSSNMVMALAAGPDLLAELSLEELGNIRVTSVSRTEEQLSAAAAAVTVVTARDIRRSGATSVPEALRMVPGLHVARQNASTWAISSRGFSSSNSAKLLVLSDTRSVYTPLFSGVFWDVQDYLMQDIDRIEVIRGPGATMWGSNAVNGVINITTKRADQTQGGLVEATAGDEERLIAAARYGGVVGDDVYYRVFMQHSERDDSYAPEATSSDDWRISHFGFRSDWQANARDSVTLQGDLYQGDIGQLVPQARLANRPGPQGNLEADVEGGNILGRWQRQLDGDGELQLRAYYDYTRRDDPSFLDELATYDIDFQHRFALGAIHQVTWGMNYRSADNENRGRGIFAVEPESSSDQLLGAFLQDQMALSESVQLTIGTKVENNDFSGVEWQPSVRLAWQLREGHNAWAAVSRAVRVPTRYERDIAIDVNIPGPGEPQIRIEGNSDFESEELVAYEMGYRWQATRKLAFDLAVFHNDYENLTALEFGQSYFDPNSGRTVIPLVAENVNEGHTQGFEALARYLPRDNWQLTLTYTYLDMEIDVGGDDLNRDALIEDSTPRHQFALRSSHDWRGFEFDLQYRYLSEIQHLRESVTGAGLSSYSEIDLRVARRLTPQIEVALIGRSLLDDSHQEFGGPDSSGEVERSIYGKIVWTF